MRREFRWRESACDHMGRARWHDYGPAMDSGQSSICFTAWAVPIVGAGAGHAWVSRSCWCGFGGAGVRAARLGGQLKARIGTPRPITGSGSCLPRRASSWGQIPSLPM